MKDIEAMYNPTTNAKITYMDISIYCIFFHLKNRIELPEDVQDFMNKGFTVNFDLAFSDIYMEI